MQERDILLIAKISDALAHPARIKIFRYIMTSNKKRERVCNKVRKEDRYSYDYVHLGTLNDYLVATKKFENMEA